jgi:translocation and assembly module TamA
MRGVSRLALFIAALWGWDSVFADSLSYTVEGVRGKLQDNIQAWLGEAPESAQERSMFIARLDERVSSALQAMGYYNADIATHIDKSESEWRLLITITANAPVVISKVDVRVVGQASDNTRFNTLIENSLLLQGTKLDHGEYERLKNGLLSLGQRLGYFEGELITQRVDVIPANNSASIQIEYNSGDRYRFGELQFDRDEIAGDLVESLQTFHQGDFFDSKRLQSFQAELQQTRFFTSVVVLPQLREARDKTVPVLLKLYPAKRHSFDVGAGFSTDTEERVSVTWRSPNLNRYGHSQETRFEYSAINPSGRINYNIPLSHPLNDVLRLSARLEENEYGDIDSRQKELAVRREMRSAEGWIRSYFLRSLNESWELVGQHNDNAYILPGVTLSNKKRRGPLVDPIAGFSQIYRLEGGSADLGSDIDLLRLYSNFTFVTTPAARHRIVARAELGAVFLAEEDRINLAPSLSFFAGGSQSIRGYDYQSLGNEVQLVQRDDSETSLTVGGDRLLTSSLEYQYYVNDTWRGAVFVDAGDAFDEGEFEVNVGAGFGVHYLTSVGAIKIEIANSVSEDDPSWRLHVNIGAEF